MFGGSGGSPSARRTEAPQISLLERLGYHNFPWRMINEATTAHRYGSICGWSASSLAGCFCSAAIIGKKVTPPAPPPVPPPSGWRIIGLRNNSRSLVESFAPEAHDDQTKPRMMVQIDRNPKYSPSQRTSPSNSSAWSTFTARKMRPASLPRETIISYSRESTLIATRVRTKCCSRE